VAYMDHKKQQALEFIRNRPRWFAWATARRIIFIWTGYWSLDRDYLKQEELDPPNIFFCSTLTILTLIGLWRALKANWRRALPYALVLFSFLLIYYVTSPEVYYRRPIDPFFVILATVALIPGAGRPPIKKRRLEFKEKGDLEAAYLTS
jgi:hypothetical protein